MSTTILTVPGTVTADGALQLDTKQNLPPLASSATGSAPTWKNLRTYQKTLVHNLASYRNIPWNPFYYL